jgi:hypothetical protein
MPTITVSTKLLKDPIEIVIKTSSTVKQIKKSLVAILKQKGINNISEDDFSITHKGHVAENDETFSDLLNDFLGLNSGYDYDYDYVYLKKEGALNLSFAPRHIKFHTFSFSNDALARMEIDIPIDETIEGLKKLIVKEFKRRTNLDLRPENIDLQNMRDNSSQPIKAAEPYNNSLTLKSIIPENEEHLWMHVEEIRCIKIAVQSYSESITGSLPQTIEFNISPGATISQLKSLIAKKIGEKINLHFLSDQLNLSAAQDSESYVDSNTLRSISQESDLNLHLKISYFRRIEIQSSLLEKPMIIEVCNQNYTLQNLKEAILKQIHNDYPGLQTDKLELGDLNHAKFEDNSTLLQIEKLISLPADKDLVLNLNIDKATLEKAAQEKVAQEKAAQEKAAQEKAVQEKAAQEKAAQKKAAQEKAAQERADAVRQTKKEITDCITAFERNISTIEKTKIPTAHELLRVLNEAFKQFEKKFGTGTMMQDQNLIIDFKRPCMEALKKINKEGLTQESRFGDRVNNVLTGIINALNHVLSTLGKLWNWDKSYTFFSLKDYTSPEMRAAFKNINLVFDKIPNAEQSSQNKL